MKLPVELQPGEAVVLRVHRHPIYMIMKLTGAALAGIFPVALLLWLGFAVAGASGVAAQLLGAGCALWVGYWLVRAYFIWYRHQHDEWVITNQRLIDSFKRHWFDHQISSADLVNVQDITVERSGLLPTMFNFGDVRCQTAGERSAFVLAAVPQPSAVLAIVDRTRDTARLESAGHRPRQGQAGGDPDEDSPPVPDTVPRK